MTGFQVDEPAFHLDISSLSPVNNFVTCSGPEHAHQGLFATLHNKQEDPSLHEFQSKILPPQSFSPSQSMGCISKLSSVTEEKGNKGTDCFGKLLCGPAKSNNWGMNYLGKMIVPAGEKKKNHDDYVCRGMSEMRTLKGDDQGHVGDVQASMAEIMKGGHMGGFKGYLGNEGDYESSSQASKGPVKGGHLGRLKEYMGHEGNYVGDLQASMEALNCNSPAGDNSFWRFLPSNNEVHPMDFFSGDEFRMYEFKVRRCMRGRSHDWTECPFAHPGEKARRRDPRRFHYAGTACPDFRRGTCRRGDSCELSHGVFECWLHPARYRTQLCKDSKSCKRRVCFFAHSPSQLRFVSPDPVPNNGFALNQPLASLTDAMTSYPAVPHKHSPFFAEHLSHTRLGSLNPYGADGFFDGSSPKSIPGFPSDGIHDGISPITDHNHSPNHSKRVLSDGNLEGFSGKKSHGHGLSIGDLSNDFKLNSTHDHSCSYIPSIDVPLVDEFGYQASHGHSYPYAHSLPPSDSSSFKTSQTHASLRNQLALASLTSNLDQIMSPTSTLIGHVFSPPPLSPPLSPSESPPMSPGTPFSGWSTVLSRKIASLSGHPLLFDALSQTPASGVDGSSMVSNGTSPAVNQFQASLLANLAHSNGATMFASTRGPSPLSTNSMGDQTDDLDRLSLLPTFLNSKELIKDEGLHTAYMEAHHAHAMAHLNFTLQQMELRRAATNEMKNNRRSSYLSQSIPNSPKSSLETGQRESWVPNDVPSHQRVESGQGLRAQIYGKLGKEAAGFDVENPDLGWVNELVK